MENIFFIADTHFSSESILWYENRPFEDSDQMDSTIIRNWNKTVSKEDIVWHLGDFGAGGHERSLLRELNGRKYLVKGNHDSFSNEYYRDAGFEWVYDYPVIIDEFWILSHEPMYINTNMPYANIFGHVHANPCYKDFSRQHMCVCVERIQYTPISFIDLKKKCSSVRSARI